MGRAKRIQDLWAIRHVVECGSQLSDGRITRQNARVIRPGDFVDVLVTVQAVSVRLPRGKRAVEVLFVPQTVIRLLNTAEALVRVRSLRHSRGC